MASQDRRRAADTELGRRHPYATLYGGWALAAVGVLVAVMAVAKLWSARPDLHLPDLPGGPGPHPAWLLLALVPTALWLWLSPSRRLNRDIRRNR